jgi:hypothetical protein
LGSGTTALVADRLGLNCIGIDVSTSYAEMARERIEGDAPLLAQVDIIKAEGVLLLADVQVGTTGMPLLAQMEVVE